MTKITKRLVESCEASGRDYFLWDDDLQGFGLRVFASGRRSYLVQYRKDGRSRRVTIGSHGRLTPEEARKEARILLGDVARGENPAEERAQAHRDPTVREFCDYYLEEGPLAKPNKKESSWKSDRSLIRAHILPLLGNRKLKTITRRDVEKFQRDIADGKTARTIDLPGRSKSVVSGGRGTATRTLASFSAMLSFAVQRGFLDFNPALGVQKFKQRKMQRFLTVGEIGALGDAITAMERTGEISIYSAAAIRLLLLTGCRRGEILELKWRYVDLERGVLRLPDSKTGAKVVPLGQPCVDLLRDLPRMEGTDLVVPSILSGGVQHGMQSTWEKVRARAGLDDVRIHDLRHSFASVAVMGGASLYMVGKILGHKQTSTTEIYAHLADDPLKAAADTTASQIAALLNQGRAR